MRKRQWIGAVAAAVALGAWASGAQAAGIAVDITVPASTTGTNPNGVLDQITSIDWDQNGSLVIGANRSIPGPSDPASGAVFTVEFWFQSVATGFSSLAESTGQLTYLYDSFPDGSRDSGTEWEMTVVAAGTQTFKHIGVGKIQSLGGTAVVEWYIDDFDTEETQGGLDNGTGGSDVADKPANNPTGAGYADGNLVMVGVGSVRAGDIITFGQTSSEVITISPTWVDVSVFDPDLWNADIDTTIQFDLQGGPAGNIQVGGVIGTAGADSQYLPADPAHGIPPKTFSYPKNVHTVGGILVGNTFIPDIVVRADANSTFTPVPEPGTLILLGSGLLGLAGYGRRRRTRKA